MCVCACVVVVSVCVRVCVCVRVHVCIYVCGVCKAFTGSLHCVFFYCMLSYIIHFSLIAQWRTSYILSYLGLTSVWTVSICVYITYACKMFKPVYSWFPRQILTKLPSILLTALHLLSDHNDIITWLYHLVEQLSCACVYTSMWIMPHSWKTLYYLLQLLKHLRNNSEYSRTASQKH